MNIVEAALLAPGACYLTGTVDGPFFDTGLDIEDLATTGRVYLAESTIADLAQQLGYAPPVAWQRARFELESALAALAAANHLNEVLRATNTALVSAGFENPDPMPAGDLEAVMEWVHSDPERVRHRAEQAFYSETQEPRPRQALLKALGTLIKEQHPDGQALPV